MACEENVDMCLFIQNEDISQRMFRQFLIQIINILRNYDIVGDDRELCHLFKFGNTHTCTRRASKPSSHSLILSFDPSPSSSLVSSVSHSAHKSIKYTIYKKLLLFRLKVNAQRVAQMYQYYRV